MIWCSSILLYFRSLFNFPFGPVYGSGDAFYISGEWQSSRLLLTQVLKTTPQNDVPVN